MDSVESFVFRISQLFDWSILFISNPTEIETIDTWVDAYWRPLELVQLTIFYPGIFYVVIDKRRVVSSLGFLDIFKMIFLGRL